MGEIHEKRNLNANDRQEVKVGSQKPPKDGNESQTHGFSNALLVTEIIRAFHGAFVVVCRRRRRRRRRRDLLRRRR